MLESSKIMWKGQEVCTVPHCAGQGGTILSPRKTGQQFRHNQARYQSQNNRGVGQLPPSEVSLICYTYWHERAAFQRSAFGRLTAGNDVVAIIIISLFFFFPVFFPQSQPFLIEGVLGSKKLIQRKLLRMKLRGRHLSRPCRPFWGPLMAILDFATRLVFLY